MHKILLLTDPEALNPHIAGGKGASLARLAQLGLNVPAAIIVTDAACHDMNASVLDDIRAFTGDGSDRRFAVRSSALDEDGAAHSFAGQHESFLDVAATDVENNVRKCHASFFSARAQKYREQKNIEPALGGAVIVQDMAAAYYSGIAFSIDPGWEDKSKAVIEYAEGSGEQIASGDITPLMAHIDKNTLEIEPDIDSPLLANMLRRVTEIAIICEQEWESPVDIEFTMDQDGKISVLQCRPITGI